MQLGLKPKILKKRSFCITDPHQDYLIEPSPIASELLHYKCDYSQPKSFNEVFEFNRKCKSVNRNKSRTFEKFANMFYSKPPLHSKKRVHAKLTDNEQLQIINLNDHLWSTSNYSFMYSNKLQLIQQNKKSNQSYSKKPSTRETSPEVNYRNSSQRIMTEQNPRARFDRIRKGKKIKLFEPIKLQYQSNLTNVRFSPWLLMDRSYEFA